MELSVVVPTLNGRDRLGGCLDALSSAAPDAEVIVVNGPSADGTTGMVRDRDDVDVLVEVSARMVTVARNAGIEVASGDVIAIVGYDVHVSPNWIEGITAGLENASVVTGPVQKSDSEEPSPVEQRTIAGRSVTYVQTDNVAFEADTLTGLDGYDEYLATGGSRDISHRLAGMSEPVAYEPSMCVTRINSDGHDRDWGWKYRALAYRLVKNYGIRPTVCRRTLSHATSDSIAAAKDVARGEGKPSAWFGTGRDVVVGMTTGFSDGLVARARDRSPSRNPHGISKRADRAVARYDWRNMTNQE